MAEAFPHPHSIQRNLSSHHGPVLGHRILEKYREGADRSGIQWVQHIPVRHLAGYSVRSSQQGTHSAAWGNSGPLRAAAGQLLPAAGISVESWGQKLTVDHHRAAGECSNSQQGPVAGRRVTRHWPLLDQRCQQQAVVSAASHGTESGSTASGVPKLRLDKLPEGHRGLTDSCCPLGACLTQSQ